MLEDQVYFVLLIWHDEVQEINSLFVLQCFKSHGDRNLDYGNGEDI